MISHKDKCIFIHIPKTAGESIETILMGRPNWEADDPKLKELSATDSINISDDKHWPLYKWVDSPYYEDYFKFSFVRNPWAASVSFYHYRKKRDGFSHTFKEWIKGVNPDFWKEFLNPLRYLRVNGKIGVDFIGRFEHLDRDWAYVCGRLGLPNTPLPVVNKTSNSLHYSEYYDDFCIKYIAEKCAEEIEYFGYSFGEELIESPATKEDSSALSLNNISNSFWINLDRRTDRADHIKNHLPFRAHRVSAVDAQSLELTPEIQKLFPSNYSVLTKAVIACALSHYYLWRKLAESKRDSSYLILEDDVVFEDGFAEKWNNEFSHSIPSDYYLVFLGGCQPWNKSHYPEVLDPYNAHFNRVKKNDFFTAGTHYWHMNAQSYILSKTGASLLCQWVDQHGFDLKKGQGQDIFAINFFNNNKLFSAPDRIYHLNPLMTHQLHEENDNAEIDKNSDLRFAADKFRKDSNESISVVIPTIWRANEYLVKSLYFLERNSYVSEILIINNDPSITPSWVHHFKKVKLLDQDKNLYFNGSINLAIPLCQSDLCCIFNDDIIVDQSIFKFASENIDKDEGAAFINPAFINKADPRGPGLEISNEFDQAGSGMLMFLIKKSFVPIPRALTHHFGDVFIFKVNQLQKKQNYFINGFSLETPGSASEDGEVKKIINRDWAAHKEVFENLGRYLNKSSSKLTIIWQVDPNDVASCYETDWIHELFSGVDFDEIIDTNFQDLRDNSLIVYNDIHKADATNEYTTKLYSYLKEASLLENCSIMHLGDEFTRAQTTHYKDFKHVIRTTYNKNVCHLPNVLQIPLGYKQGFHGASVDSEVEHKILKPPSDLLDFPFLSPLICKDIPKLIHLTWRHKNILSNRSPLILNGVGNLPRLNPDWSIEVSDDDDVERYLRDNLGRESYKAISSKKMVEKTDLWRLLKIFNEGGLYMDIDRYCNISLSDILEPLTKCVLPTFQDIDFSQDFLLSVSGNPIYGEAINSNLMGRRAGKGLFYLAVESYMQSVSKVLGGDPHSRNPGPHYWDRIRHDLNSCPFLHTYRENKCTEKIIFNYDPASFICEEGRRAPAPDDLFDEYMRQKALFYHSEGVESWNADYNRKFKKYISS